MKIDTPIIVDLSNMPHTHASAAMVGASLARRSDCCCAVPCWLCGLESASVCRDCCSPADVHDAATLPAMG